MLRASAESRQPSESERSIASELSIASPQKCGGSWSLRESKVPLYLPLGLTFDATLARIGQRTRSNLRYYRRRSEADLGCSFVANVTIDLQDFLAFNRECTYAVPDALAKWRYRSLGTLINPFLRGIRDGNGRWLSLVGGRRQCGFAEIDWQMNRADLPQYSLSTVLRSYLLEHEVREGSSRLYIEGGTPHPIGRSFVSGHVNELTLKRSSPYVELMEKFSRRPFLAKNHLAQTLQDPDLRWTSW